ncbi:MAG: uroporphyrinogen-III synthase [Pseudomonadota bacterium]
MCARLSGKRILLTRPRESAAGLAEMIVEAGGEPICVPAMEIATIENVGPARAQLQAAHECAVVIFISRNAVEHANAITPLASIGIGIAVAPGKTTAQALRDCGVGNVAVPQYGHDSTAMLAMTAFTNISKQSVLIVRGEGGLDQLRDKLTQLKANVRVCEVYRRRKPDSCHADLKQSLDSPLDAICVASGETLQNLVDGESEEIVTRLHSATLFVPSERVSVLAKAMGFRRCVVATSPDDIGYLDSLKNWGAPPTWDSHAPG